MTTAKATCCCLSAFALSGAGPELVYVASCFACRAPFGTADGCMLDVAFTTLPSPTRTRTAHLPVN